MLQSGQVYHNMSFLGKPRARDFKGSGLCVFQDLISLETQFLTWETRCSGTEDLKGH